MKKLMYFLSFVVMTVMSVSCSNEESESVTPPTNEKAPKHATMLLNASKPSFEDEGTTRAATDSWANGAKVYLQFKDATAQTYGIATYNSSTSEWSIIYYGTLASTNDGKCEAYFFENAGEESYIDIALTASTIIYADKSASYTFEDNALTVTANLKPMTGRIRFKGTTNAEIYMEGGLKYYSKYNFTSNTFNSSDLFVSVSTVNKDGYTNYLYCFFPEDAEKQIIFNDKEQNVSFYRTLGNSALAVGKSGYLNIPTMDNSKGWNLLRFKDYSVGNVTFRMMRVVGDGFVTNVRSFMIGETEVTQALWKAIMNTNPSSPQGDDLPVNNVSWESCKEFINKLNTKTGGDFWFPNMNQWQWAAKGGNLSKGYNYSGSNTVESVAWYSGNSGSTTHQVKTKQPNEIGLYDMSGNVSEWTCNQYNNSTYTYYHCGGAYGQSASYVTWNSSSYTSSSSNYIGLRLFTY